MLVRAQQHDTLDLLCHRHLGTTSGVVEAALELNRKALFNETADLSEATLTHGQLVMLPDPAEQIAPTVSSISLWD